MSYENWKVKKDKFDSVEYSQVAEWCNDNGYMIIEDGDYYAVKELQISEKSSAEERFDLIQYLADTDYVVIKIAEGVATAEEYKEVLTARAKARARINEIDEAQDDSIK